MKRCILLVVLGEYISDARTCEYQKALNIVKLSRDVSTIMQSVSKKGHEINFSILEVAKRSLKSC